MQVQYAVRPLSLSSSFETDKEHGTTHPYSTMKLWLKVHFKYLILLPLLCLNYIQHRHL